MKSLLFLGSVRESTPPKPARLGARVAEAVARLARREGMETEIVDPLDFQLEAPFKPHFAYASGRAPKSLDDLAGRIRDADCYLMVSPEYNHSMSPALADLLNHFGSSIFSYKPSAIVTYSAGQWGGTRAAVTMRSFLSELGCLPVSAMIHVPKAQEVLSEDGTFHPDSDEERWNGYFSRTISQLSWWSAAALEQRRKGLPTKAFNQSPSQRNAPGA
ncbi:NADPH-dependent FMN reductase [Amaricoccus macauensis]|uniref:NADPH-dependent FMN reductase n=1 Tax=Amaricoccus macauensis TaxID=57001 RepID=UPI003C7D0139